jgi:predicted nucleic acid-binding protein
MGEAEFRLSARLKAELVEKGIPIGNKDADIFIAAYCIINGYTLVTDNINDFNRIDKLKFINWKK